MIGCVEIVHGERWQVCELVQSCLSSEVEIAEMLLRGNDELDVGRIRYPPQDPPEQVGPPVGRREDPSEVHSPRWCQRLEEIHHRHAAVDLSEHVADEDLRRYRLEIYAAVAISLLRGEVVHDLLERVGVMPGQHVGTGISNPHFV
ncbi:hypothetical protein [Nocardia sp. NBC_01377]|uniref:hypothetical protein n=1 Tax=Nocardia sp. NBC_01377 TaxID=2903595 RepID=UPI00386AC145